MTITLDNYESFRISVTMGQHEVNFFAFNGLPREEVATQIREMQPFFDRMPPVHALGIAPIFLLVGRPSGGSGGGTYPDLTRLRARNEANRARNDAAWGAPYDVLEAAIAAYGRHDGGRRLHVIPLERWQRPARATTVIHECAHGVDHKFHLHRRRHPHDPLRPGPLFAVSDFPTQLPGQACGHGSALNRAVVNAYVSMTMGFRGVSTAMRRQIINNFRNSDAFINVQDSWWQGRFPGLI
ncbi:hypothetical protein [Yoonia sp. SDW83-1]|uniref:hypothetical protein n=1 Tax=Yoonia sp. SDW83-1 TaxID=3366945 RepID=UPI00398C479F